MLCRSFCIFQMTISQDSVSPTPTVSSTEQADPQADSCNKARGPLHHASRCSDLLHRRVHQLYAFWARLVVAHAYKIVIVCLIVTAVCAVKMVKTRHKNNISGYTPYGSRALYEFAVQDEFFDQSGHGVKLLLLILPANGSNNLMHMHALDEAVEVDRLVQRNLTIFNREHQREEAFADFCKHFCHVSEPVQLFAKGFKDQYERFVKGEELNPRIQLDYPFSTIYGQEINLQPNFYGVHQPKSWRPKLNFTTIDRIESIMIRYRVERLKGWDDDDVSNYELMINNYFEKNYTGHHIRVLTMSSSSAQKEIDRSGNILRSYVGMGLGVMVLCSLLTNSLSAYFMQQFSIYRLPVAAFACFCPFMAAATALGTLFFLGVRNGSILGVTPFLILAIGIDDAFLTIHAWQLGIKRKRQNGTLKAISHKDPNAIDAFVSQQLIEVLDDIGPAVMISALTNIFADLVGMWTGSPEITLLCIGNIASIIVDFFYQITLFTAVLIICARWELRSELKRNNDEIPPNDHNNENGHDVLKNGQIGPPSPAPKVPTFRPALRDKFYRVTDAYIRFLSNTVAAAFICIVSALFLYICLRAVLKFEINLTTRKLFPPDSPLLEVDNYREEKLLPFYTMAQIFVNNPGDLSNATRRHRLDAFIDEMEHLPYAYSAKSSIYYPRLFEESLSPDAKEAEEEEAEPGGSNGNETAEESDEMAHQFDVINEVDSFLNMTEYKQFEGLVKYHKERNGTKTVLDSFLAIVAYHGDKLKEWYERAVMLQDWRRVADKYTDEFNISVLHDDGLFLDLLENMPNDIWQSALGTLVCMAIICAIFMNFNPFVVIVTSAVIASILIETLGIMALMGMTIDPVVMAAVIISMGFSVDIPAHVAYHFHAAKWTDDGVRERSIEERIRVAFASVGFPAIQASLCTNICVLCLLIVPVYPAQVFVRVLCTCITLCTVTSLCLLPALFKVLDSIGSLISCSK